MCRTVCWREARQKGVACEFGVHPDVNWSELKLLLTKYIQEDSEIVLPSGQSLFDGQGVLGFVKFWRHMPNLKAYKNSQVECPVATPTALL